MAACRVSARRPEPVPHQPAHRSGAYGARTGPRREALRDTGLAPGLRPPLSLRVAVGFRRLDTRYLSGSSPGVLTSPALFSR